MKPLTDNKKLLTQDDVRNLDNGTRITVFWSGGNGPHEYLKGPGPSARLIPGEHMCPTDYVGELDFVGKKTFNDRVWLTEEDQKG